MVVLRDPRLLLMSRCADAFSDHELAHVSACLDCFDSLVQALNDLLACRWRSLLDLVHLAVCHLNDAVREVF